MYTSTKEISKVKSDGRQTAAAIVIEVQALVIRDAWGYLPLRTARSIMFTKQHVLVEYYMFGK